MRDEATPSPDSASEAARLLAATKPFDRLADEARVSLAGHARERRFMPGEIIVREGEPGDEFFLIADGAVHVLGRGFDDTDLVLARLEAGSCFGEQALLADRPVPRSASVRSATRCRLLVLPRDALGRALEKDEQILALLRQTGETQKAERSTLFRERILGELGIGAGYAVEHFAAGSFVFHEGDTGDKIYLIVTGRALVLKRAAALPLAELLPGQFFGELAILDDAPRVASIKAAEPMQVAALEGAWFRSTLDRNPRLRSVMASLRSMYVLPARGLVTLQSSGLASHPTLTAVHHLPEGRRVLSMRVPEANAFRAQLMGMDEATRSIRFEADGAGLYRQLHLLGGKIIELEAEGAWPGLGAAFERLLGGTAVDEDEIAAFETGGDLGTITPPARDAAEVVCRCSGATTAAIVSAIGQGCTDLDQISEATRAGVVCGGCIPILKEFLGQEEWHPASCEAAVPLSERVRMFRLRTRCGLGRRLCRASMSSFRAESAAAGSSGPIPLPPRRARAGSTS